jgi:dolichol kinase
MDIVAIFLYLIAIIFGWSLSSPFIEKVLISPFMPYLKGKLKMTHEEAEKKATHYLNVFFVLIVVIGISLITLIYS